MTRPPSDDLESRLGRDLHSLTDGVVQPRDWRADARAVAVEAGSTGGSWRRWALAGGSVAAGIAAVAFAVAVGIPPAIPGVSPEPSGSASPVPSEASTSSTSPSETAAPSVETELNFSTAAWWDRASFGFGYAMELPSPQPVELVLPEGGNQIRIGTLDGRVNAVLVVNEEWGHWAVGGPLDGKVLVADDVGGASVIRSVTADTGAVEPIAVFQAHVVTAVEPARSGDGFFYGRADRATGADQGIWFRSWAGNEFQVDQGPDGFAMGVVAIWRIAAAPDGRHLVTQYCHGEVACETHVVDLESRDWNVTTEIGWVQGFIGRAAGSAAYARPLVQDQGEVVPGSDLVTVDLAAMTVAPANVPRTPERRDRFDVELPDGWFPSWLDQIPVDALRHDTASGSVSLRRVDGTVVDVAAPDFEWPVACGPIMPRELPSGRTTNAAVLTLEDGIRGARIGQGDDLVFESFGNYFVDVIDAETISIRGERAQLTQSRWPWDLPPDSEFPGLERSVPAFLFYTDGCSYSVSLPGLTLEEAREYAARF